VIVCPRCSKENQDHYKFCLGCGSELPREPARKELTKPEVDEGADRNLQFAETQQGDASSVLGAAQQAKQEAAAAEPAAAPEPTPKPAAASEPAAAPSGTPPAAAAVRPCPSCSNPVPPDFKFCGTCGHRMDDVSAPPASPPPAAPAPSETPAKARGALTVINPDGSEGDVFTFGDGVTSIGRNAGGPFAVDAYLSPNHATLTISGSDCKIRDEDSLNAVYLKIGRDEPVALANGDVFRIGQEIIRFEEIPPTQEVGGIEPMGSPNPGFLGRLCLVIGRDAIGNAFTIPSDGLHIGRERGDVVFPEDGYVSGLHCRIHGEPGKVTLTDVGSSNGTFVRVKGERNLQNGDLLLLGQQLFRITF
jgi:pSer/pThr/pTyr-binding forkhead associated (FHA) protein